VKSLSEIKRDAVSAIHINLDIIGVDDSLLSELKEILEDNKGSCQVIFHLKEKKGADTMIKAHSSYNISVSEELIKDLTRIIGQNAISYTIGNC